METLMLPFEAPVASLQQKIDHIRSSADAKKLAAIKSLEDALVAGLAPLYGKLSPMECAQLARHPARPYALDFIGRFIDEFVEIKGDRQFNDDAAIVAGVGRLKGTPCVVVGNQKGRDTKEKLTRNFGMARPAGYRKAARIYDLADAHELPIIALIDTPGAFPGVDAEEQGQSAAIAQCIQRLANVRVPVVAIVTGEGGSGGALALSVADRVAMLEYSVFSVISPEGCAAILWKSALHAETAANAMGIDARSVLRAGLIDDVIPEPVGGAHRFPLQTADAVANYIWMSLQGLRLQPIDQLVKARHDRLHAIDGNGSRDALDRHR